MFENSTLYIIDGNGPFFSFHPKGTINWSKIPFDHLTTQGILDLPEARKKIVHDFETFVHRAKQVGYTAISLDDIPHLVEHPWYTTELNKKISSFAALYSELFAIVKQQKLNILMNCDLMFFNKEIYQKTKKGRDEKIIPFLNNILESACTTFPLDGIIFRFGESDGVDVKGDFVSRLMIKTPKQLHTYIQALLPVFEQHEKLCIMRTWAVGAYSIGDIMWNPKTYDHAFSGIDSPNFIVSMKYGQSDFYSQLPLNPLFFHGKQKKIIELQTKREFEGFGSLPLYTGFQYEKYAREVRNLETFAGISVWCQTGGWSENNNLTFLKSSSQWVEINTKTTLDIFKDGKTAKDALRNSLSEESAKFVEQYTKAFINIVYIPPMDTKNFFFRRVHLPPLFWVYWNIVSINSLITSFYKVFHAERSEISEDTFLTLTQLGENAEIHNLSYYIDTLKILQRCREVLVGSGEVDELKKLAKQYEDKYPETFTFSISNSKQNKILFMIEKCVLRFFVRTNSRYRIRDKVLLYPIVSILLLFLAKKIIASNMSFANEQAMSLDTILK